MATVNYSGGREAAGLACTSEQLYTRPAPAIARVSNAPGWFPKVEAISQQQVLFFRKCQSLVQRGSAGKLRRVFRDLAGVRLYFYWHDLKASPASGSDPVYYSL